MKKIVTFGEIMLRLSPRGYYRLFQSSDFEAAFGGGEANAAVSLANYGMEAEFVSKVPDNEIGKAASSMLNSFGVKTENVVYGGERLGIYFYEKGASQRASKVIYDRKHSAIAESSSEEFDWDKILDNSEWFHFTGITPALSDSLAQTVLEACQTAAEKGITVSCDLNFRKKLWAQEKACRIMSELMRYVSVCIANEEDAEAVFGIKAEHSDVYRGRIVQDGYVAVARQLAEQFQLDKVAVTLRSSHSSSDNGWAAMLYADGKAYFSDHYEMRIVDRVGGGDSFGGALIYSLMTGKSPQDAVNFAAAASCLKHSIEGDFNRVTTYEIEQLIKNGGSGRIQR